jgi:glycosyltransferase involved in cell wall biosynthesis
MAERLEGKGAARDRLHVIHNWSDGEALGSVDPKENWFLDQHGLRGKFVVLYSGNMGRGHDLATLLAAAEKLHAREEIVFLFIGEGARRAEVESAAGRLGNVRLLPYQRREDLPYSLGSANLSAITMVDGLAGLIVPSKLYGALASRTPVLFVGPGESETARIVAETGCGTVFARGDVEGVSAFISDLARRPKLGAQMGERGRAAFEQRFDRAIATRRFGDLLMSVCGEAAGRAATSEELTA